MNRRQLFAAAAGIMGQAWLPERKRAYSFVGGWKRRPGHIPSMQFFSRLSVYVDGVLLEEVPLVGGRAMFTVPNHSCVIRTVINEQRGPLEWSSTELKTESS